MVTSVTAKDKKTAQKPSPSSSTSSTVTSSAGTSSAKRSKKSRVETVDPLLLEVVDATSSTSRDDEHEQQLCDLLDGTLHDTNLLFSQLEVEECDLFAESFCN